MLVSYLLLQPNAERNCKQRNQKNRSCPTPTKLLLIGIQKSMIVTNTRCYSKTSYCHLLLATALAGSGNWMLPALIYFSLSGSVQERKKHSKATRMELYYSRATVTKRAIAIFYWDIFGLGWLEQIEEEVFTGKWFHSGAEARAPQQCVTQQLFVNCATGIDVFYKGERKDESPWLLALTHPTAQDASHWRQWRG